MAMTVLAAIALAAAPAPPGLDDLLHAAPLVDGEVVLLGLDRGGRMTVPVSVAGTTAVPFVVDTGAERTVLSLELARSLGLAAGPTVRLVSMSGTAPTASVLVPRLDLGGRRIEGLVAPALQGRHLGAAGMIGLDSLQDRRVVLDFAAGTMTVEPAVRRRREPAAADMIVVEGRSRYGQLILVDAGFRGERIAVILDTGAEISVANRALERRLSARRGDEPVVLTSVVGGLVPAVLRDMGPIRLGGLTLGDLRVAVADAPPFARLGLADTPAMLLGMDALRAFRRVSIDFPNRRVRFDLARP